MGGFSSKPVEEAAAAVAETATEVAKTATGSESGSEGGIFSFLGSFGTGWLALALSVIMFGVGGGIVNDSISVDQSAKSGAVAGLFISGAFLFIVFLMSRGAPSDPEGLKTLPERFSRIFPAVTGSVSNWFRITWYFLPYAIFVSGALIDITTTRLQFFPAGLTAILAVILNYLVSSAISGPVTDRDLCGVPGLSALGSDWAPQSAVFNLTALSYIATFITIKQGIFGVNKVWPAWVTYVAVAVINAIVLFAGGCFVDGMDFAKKMGLAVVSATSIGAIGAWIASQRIPAYDDGSGGGGGSIPLIGPDGIQRCPDGSLPGPTGICPIPTPPASQTCSAMGDDQFVCEAYKNGQLVTSTIVE